MAYERLPVNVFEGILPSAYNFIDGMDNPDRWELVPAAGATYTATAFDAGYIGKSIRFAMNAGLGIVGTSDAYRYFTTSLSGSFNVGFIFRPVIVPATPWFAPAFGVNMFRLIVNIPTPTYERRYFEIKNDFMDDFAGGLYRLSLSGVTEDIVTTTAVRYYGTVLPWYRVIVYVDNGIITAVNLNNIMYVANTQLLTVVGSSLSSGVLNVRLQKEQATAELVQIDLDQIWVSETENRI